MKEKRKAFYKVCFSYLLTDMSTPAEALAKKHKCPLGMVEKYYAQFFEKYNGGTANE